MRKTILILILVLGAAALVLLMAIQLIPVRRDNPHTVTLVQWDSPETQALFQRACADCHSNDTVWPAYAYVAPVSWLVARDVDEGREHFNISDLTSGEHAEHHDLMEELQETLEEGEMPLRSYVMMHPAADLTPAERRALLDGLENTLEASLPGN